MSFKHKLSIGFGGIGILFLIIILVTVGKNYRSNGASADTLPTPTPAIHNVASLAFCQQNEQAPNCSGSATSNDAITQITLAATPTPLPTTSPITTSTPSPTSTPTAALTISNITVSRKKSDHSATISWNTNSTSTGKIDYSLTKTNLSSSKTDATISLNHSVTLTSLTRGKTYYYRITAISSTNQQNQAISSIRNFTAQ